MLETQPLAILLNDRLISRNRAFSWTRLPATNSQKVFLRDFVDSSVNAYIDLKPHMRTENRDLEILEFHL